VKSICY